MLVISELSALTDLGDHYSGQGYGLSETNAAAASIHGMIFLFPVLN